MPLAACAETAQGPLAGASDAWASAPEPTSPTPVASNTPHVAWAGYAEVLRLPALTSAAFTSQGHPLSQQVEVRVNDRARAAYTALVTDTVFPDGSVLAELTHGTSGNGYVMRKSAGAWSYFELDSQGALLAGGAIPLCSGCHAQAPADCVFGLPRPR